MDTKCNILIIVSKMELVDGRYKLYQKIGRGSFGTVYHGIHIRKNYPVAVKIEKSNIKHTQLRTESRIYSIMKKEVGFPKQYWFGQFNE